jgi:RNA polymerase sigma factor (sigma-70 family)
MQQSLKKRGSDFSKDIICNPDQNITLYYRYLFSYAFSRVRDKDIAKDLVQESFLAALEKPGTFKHKCSEKTWLVAILKNKITDHYRSKKSECRHLTLLDPPAHCEMFSAQHDLLPLLGKAVGKLPELWQTVFNMKHLEDQPASTICRELNLTASNYWVISHRTRAKLKSSLHNHV